MDRKRGLIFTLAIAFFGLAFFVLLSTALPSLYINFKSEQKSVYEVESLIAQKEAQKVADFINQKFQVMEVITKVVGAFDSFGLNQRVVLERILGVEPSFRQIILLDNNKQEEVGVSRHSNFTSFQVREKFNDDLFDQSSKSGRYISDVYIDEVTNEPMVLLAVVIKDVFNDSRGTLVAEVNLKFMWDLVGSIKVGKTGLAYVIDGEGNLIAFGNTSRVLKRENLSHLKVVKEFIINQEDKETNPFVVSRGVDNDYVVSAYSSLGIPNWAVVIEQSIFEAYSDFFNGLIISIVSICLIVVLLVALSLKLSRRITKPILNLTEVARKVGYGDLEARADIKEENEIGELAKSFNEMASKLSEYKYAMDEKIKERTRQLDEKLAEVEKLNSFMIDRETKMVELKKEIETLKNNKNK